MEGLNSRGRIRRNAPVGLCISRGGGATNKTIHLISCRFNEHCSSELERKLRNEKRGRIVLAAAVSTEHVGRREEGGEKHFLWYTRECLRECVSQLCRAQRWTRAGGFWRGTRQRESPLIPFLFCFFVCHKFSGTQRKTRMTRESEILINNSGIRAINRQYLMFRTLEGWSQLRWRRSGS